MTMLAVMRHAKSSWGDASLEDFDRPLNDRGHKSARLVGREAAKRKIAFETRRVLRLEYPSRLLAQARPVPINALYRSPVIVADDAKRQTRIRSGSDMSASCSEENAIA
jgi:phosphohistidine phosphatase